MDIKPGPPVLLVGVILYSIASSFLTGWEAVIALALTLVIPLLSGVNVFALLWKMKVMLFTAFLIFVFALIEKKGTLTAFADTSRFLSLITVASLFVLKTDLLSLSSSLGKILSIPFGAAGWRASSYLMLSLSFFPIVFESADEMLQARRSRGGSFFSHPVKNLTEYTVSLMRLLFEKVLIFQDALYSRSFTINGEKTVSPPERSDCILLFIFVLFFTGVIVWKKVL